MSEAILIFQHMRGGCATVGNTVHALFRVNGRRPGLASTNRLTARHSVANSVDEPTTDAREQQTV